MMVFIATTESDYEAFARLVREYVEWCRDRYKHVAWFMRLSDQPPVNGYRR